MARYYWLKLHDNFFDRMEIRKLRKIPGGDTYTIIYLKMLLFYMNSDYKIPFKGICKTIHEEVALDINEDDTSVEMTLGALKMLKLIEEKEGDLTLPEQPEVNTKPKALKSSRKALPENLMTKYGTFKNVSLSEADLDKLAEFYGSEAVMWEKIQIMSEYLKAHGKSYKDYASALMTWGRKDGFGKETKKKPKATFKEEDWT